MNNILKLDVVVEKQNISMDFNCVFPNEVDDVSRYFYLRPYTTLKRTILKDI